MKKTTNKGIPAVKTYWPFMAILLTLLFSISGLTILQARDIATDKPHTPAKNNCLNNSETLKSDHVKPCPREMDHRFASSTKFSAITRSTNKAGLSFTGNRIFQMQPILQMSLTMPGSDELVAADQDVSTNYKWDQLTVSILPSQDATRHADEAMNQEFEMSQN
jgi:hypothetical protein